MRQEQDQYHKTITNASAATSANFDITIENGVDQGSIHAVTNAAFNGTTGTLALKGSNDNVNFATVYQDDNVTAMTFTLVTDSQFSFLLKRVLYKYYRLVYTKGDATLGTLSACFNGKK